ncbi:MAG TPA: hypothetical protein V6D06_03630 [Trichocoleus sp.]
MAENYTRIQGKDQTVVLMSLALAALVLFLPWGIYRVKTRGWPKLNLARATESEFLYQKALETGWEAAVAVQTASGRQEWDQVVTRWGEAITLLEKVKSTASVRSQEAHTKLAEYRGFQQYASQQADQSPPQYSWELITELSEQVSYVLVDPDRNDALSPGPQLEIEPDHTITNVAYINSILATLGMPPIPGDTIAPGDAVQLRSNEYVLKNYPMGELSLHRTLCSDSFAINGRYDCLWKISLR